MTATTPQIGDIYTPKENPGTLLMVITRKMDSETYSAYPLKYNDPGQEEWDWIKFPYDHEWVLVARCHK